jgi:hypothetical protein
MNPPPDRLAYLWGNGWMLRDLNYAGYDLTITAQGVCNLTVIVTCNGAVAFQAQHVRSRKKAVRAAWRELIDGK